MKKPIIVYKRVQIIGDEFFSAHVYRFPDLEQQYQINKWTEALVGGLFCFLNIEDARDSGDGDAILQCEAKGHMKIPRTKITTDLSLDLVEKIWRELDGLIAWNGVIWNRGTVCFKKIKPIKLVK